jgi:CBS domain containing-hemolysin-like protein
VANLVVRAVGVQPQQELAMAHSSADLILLLNEAAEEGSIESHEHELLARSIQLSGRVASSAMTPRSRVVAVDRATPLAELEQQAVRTGRSRIVVYDSDLDHPVGVVHARDLLTHELDRSAAVAGDLVAPVMVTPDHLALERLFLDMRDQRRHLALVVDEHGVVLGLITMEDVLEELIGEFEDESDRVLLRVRRLPDGAYVLAGSVRPDELATRTGIELPEGQWDTVAGFLISSLGRVPNEGDRVEIDGAAFEVSSMDGVAVREVRVRRRAPSPP